MTVTPHQIDSILKAYARQIRRQELIHKMQSAQNSDLSLIDEATNKIVDILLGSIKKEK